MDLFISCQNWLFFYYQSVLVVESKGIAADGSGFYPPKSGIEIGRNFSLQFWALVTPNF